VAGGIPGDNFVIKSFGIKKPQDRDCFLVIIGSWIAVRSGLNHIPPVGLTGYGERA
jgi:hypothetical protein